MSDERDPALPEALTDAQVAIVRDVLAAYLVGKTPRQVADDLQCTATHVHRVRRGTVRPSPRFAARLAAAIGTDLESLLGSGGA